MKTNLKTVADCKIFLAPTKKRKPLKGYWVYIQGRMLAETVDELLRRGATVVYVNTPQQTEEEIK